jgi:glycosyltransferase involved in cell wall biosynthesis
MLRGVLVESRSRGWKPEVVFLDNSRGHEWISEFTNAGIPVSFAPSRAARSRVALGRWLDAYLGDDPGPTVLHTHFTTWDIAALIASRGRDASVFWHVHSALPKEPWVVARTALKFAMFSRSTAGLWCPAPNIVDGARRRLAAPSRLEFMPSALDMSRFPLMGAERRALAREQLGIDPEATVLMHFGWHWHLKGNDLFLEAVARLAKDDDSIVAVDRGGDERMLEYADELGIADRLRLVDPVEDVQTIHGAADVMVSSSREEGMAYAVLESLASGTPVVATRIPGHEFIGDRVAACRMVERDVPEIAARIRETLDRPSEQAQDEARGAHEWIAANLGIEPIAKRMLDLYGRAVGVGPAARVVSHGAAPRLIHMAQYGNAHPGSFVPMVKRVLTRAMSEGWQAEAIFDDAVQGSDWLRDLEDSGVRVRLAPRDSRLALGGWVGRILDEQKVPTVVHTHFTRFDVPAALATLRRKHVAVLWHEHTALSSQPSMIARNAVKFGVIGRTVDGIYCPAPDLARDVVRRLGPRHSTHFVPNAIDIDRFPLAEAAEKGEARSQLGLAADVPVVLNFGWNWDLKGGEAFQRTVVELNRRNGRSAALQLTREPQASASRSALGLESSLSLIAPTDQVQRLYAAADVFVSTSRAEGGTPLAMLEALASGVPVVASDLPGHRFIAERVPNIVICSLDPREIAAACLTALGREPDEILESGRAARSAIESEFSIDDWAARFLTVYDGLRAEFPAASTAR